jgi:catecholate siderophore receptor
LRHEVLAGIDVADENKTVYAARSAAQGGVNLTKPTTTVGTPNDGAWIDESARVLRTSQRLPPRRRVYVQDLMQVARAWKLLAGLRYDTLKGDYNAYAIPTTRPVRSRPPATA